VGWRKCPYRVSMMRHCSLVSSISSARRPTSSFLGGAVGFSPSDCILNAICDARPKSLRAAVQPSLNTSCHTAGVRDCCTQPATAATAACPTRMDL
jgi:hypothetical protein